MKGNLLLVWDRMGDYHRARWKALQEEFQSMRVYAADLYGNDDLYNWSSTQGNDLYFQLSKKPKEQTDFKRVLRFIKIVKLHSIGCIALAGYGRLEYLIFIVYGKLTGRKVILFAESWYPSSDLMDKLKSKFLNIFCDGFLVSGRRAFSHFTNRLKINADVVKVGYSVVDNQHFHSNSSALSKLNILCVARFSEEKNLLLLISAFKISNLPDKGLTLTLVGGGPLVEQLRAVADESIILIDWQSYEKLPEVYTSAKVFVLPSLFEPWGLVVNEAMASGLPIILSDEVGCLPDLLDSSNGWSFKASDENGLASLFRKIHLLSEDERKKMGASSQKKIETYSLTVFAKALKELITN